MSDKKQKNEEENGLNTGGGAYIGGNVNTSGGDFVGRDKKVSGGERSIVVGGDVAGSTIVTGDGNTVGGSVQNIFAPVYQAIQGASMPVQDKADLTAEVQEIEEEVIKGELVDETFLARRLRNLRRMAPEIGEVALAALGGPTAAVSAVVKKVAEKVKAEAG